MERGFHESALSDLARALELDPGLHKVRFNRGLMLEAMGRPEEAVEAFRDFIEAAGGEEYWAEAVGMAEKKACKLDKRLTKKQAGSLWGRLIRRGDR
jgi:tetratricopeptide (TPR) repeat protein